MKIWLTGGQGMLGTDLRTLLEEASLACAATDIEVDITDEASVARFLDAHTDVDTIVNCAAYTDVDGAEDDPETAFRINAEGPEVLARAASARGAVLYHISTDYVFPGTGEQPWEVTDTPAPVNVYGRSKLQGEEAVRASGCRFGIVRTQWLYGRSGRNFVNTIAGRLRKGEPVRVVNDQFGAATWTRDLARVLIALMQQQATGMFHASNAGYASWFEVAAEIGMLLGADAAVTPCGSETYPARAARPTNSRLSAASLAQAGVRMRPWREALEEYLTTDWNSEEL